MSRVSKMRLFYSSQYNIKILWNPMVFVCTRNACLRFISTWKEEACVVFYTENEALEFNWTNNVNIAKCVAHALSYLHHHCTPSIIYRDIWSNNNLLNLNLEAFVTNFSTARLLYVDSSDRTLRVDTFAYIALGE